MLGPCFMEQYTQVLQSGACRSFSWRAAFGRGRWIRHVELFGLHVRELEMLQQQVEGRDSD